ncbi:glycosyltransferase [Spirosoma flavum]|uniref:Glycosyltransferase n=1 Tax=Spirosoma flavum TaxID=2048557 RepID=A0ABW6ARV2_9BACT
MINKPIILFLLHLPPPIHGSSIVGLNIRNSSIINDSFQCHYINLLASNKISEAGKINFRKLIGFFNTFLKVLFFLTSHKPQLCYLALTSSGPAFIRDIIIISILKLFNVRRIYHLHNKGVKLYQNIIISRFFYNFVFKDAEVIVLSKFLYDDIKCFVSKSKIHICPNGVFDHCKNIARLEINNSRKFKITTPKILFLSNLIETKGVFVLLEALAILNQKGINFKCSFVGGESDISASKFYQFRNKLGLKDCVSYLGQKIGIEKHKIFLESDIFVLPTYYHKECFPLVLLEAMSYSLPLISTPEGGNRDIIDDGVNGFLVAHNQVDLLASKLETLIKDVFLRDKMIVASRKKYEQEFTLDIFEIRLTRIFHKVL